jgi:hypothetical protein
VQRGVLTLGVLLRLYLALVNMEANDDHLTVIRIIARQHHLPGVRDAWEGFQPKLYHVVVAILWDLSPWQAPTVLVRIAQLVACAAGIATLLVVYRAMKRWDIAPVVRVLTFALVAFNPTLIGLNAQATNDSFVILFGTMALAAGYAFFQAGKGSAFAAMSAAVVLAALSKGNGMVLFLAVLATLVLGIVRGVAVGGLSRWRLAALGAGFLTSFSILVATLGPYRRNWQDTGNPFSINGDPAPLPHVFDRTYVYRPGITSIADGYFTFRLFDMLAHPAITDDANSYPLQRTSLWSQLYGRANFVQFAQHPPSWRNTDPLVLTVGRLILILALLPTAALLVGMVRTCVAFVGGRLPLDQVLLALTALGFVAFIMTYTLIYRDFSTMKAAFLFPGTLAYAFLLATEAERFRVRWADRPGLLRAAWWGCAALGVLYVTDVAILAVQLT